MRQRSQAPTYRDPIAVLSWAKMQLPSQSRLRDEGAGPEQYGQLHRNPGGQTHRESHQQHQNFWSYATHILYNRPDVPKYHLPVYFKKLECWFEHRKENLFKRSIQVYFDCVLP